MFGPKVKTILCGLNIWYLVICDNQKGMHNRTSEIFHVWCTSNPC